MSRLLPTVLLACCLQLPLGAQGQAYPDSLRKGRLTLLLVAKGTAYSGLLVGLNQLWYKGEPRTGFHFFDDSREWQQVDKLGHAYSTYHLSRLHYQSLRWAGMAPQKATLWSSLAGFAWLLPVEFLDGFSAAYGASGSDLLANAGGALLWGGQQLLWQEQLLKPKFSFHTTRWAPLRQNLLGNALHEQILKDYNGQTYWLSADLHRITGGRTPGWLNLALGLGASGMVYADPQQNQQQGYSGYRQLFLAPDLNLSRIRTNKRGVRWLLFVLDAVHLPAPALELSRKKLYLHPVYF